MDKSKTAAVQARAFFGTQNLLFPPVPAHLEMCLVADSDHLFATVPIEPSVFDLEVWAGRVDADSAPLAVLGVDGRGINSWAVHYYLVDGPLALFVQWPWGGAYDDPDADRSRIARVFEQCAALQNLAKGAAGRAVGCVTTLHCKRLLVVHSPLADPRCIWLEVGKPAALIPLSEGVAPLMFALDLLQTA